MDKQSIFKAIFERDDKAQKEKASHNTNFFSREISGSVTQRLKQIHSKRFFLFTNAIADLISHISTRIYGTAILCFGLVGTLLYFLGLSADNNIATPILGILLSGLAIPFLLTDKPLPVFLQDFDLTDFLFFEFFCMKRHSAMESVKSFPVAVAIAIGIVLALVSALVPMWQIALAILILIAIYIGLESPEFVFLTSLLALPYIRFIPHSEIVFALAIILAVFSFIIKVMYGRRVFHFEQYDIIIGIMLLFVLISGVFVKGFESFGGSIKMLIFALGYILAGNIIANRRLAIHSANSIIFSATVSSIISISQVVTTIVNLGSKTTQSDISFVLARQDGVAAFLMVATILAIGLAAQASKATKLVNGIAAFLCLAAMVISGEFLAISSLILAFIAYFIIKHNKLPAILLTLLLAASVAVLLLPNNILNIIFTFSPSVISAKDLFNLWNKCLQLMADNLAVGIGIGAESFAIEMAAIGVVGHTDSSNLFIELGLEAGILAPICFIFVLITRLQHRYMQYLYVRNSEIERISNLSGACLFSMIAFGMVNYIWSDPSTYYLFWCVFGIGSATLRKAKKDYDDRVIYYEESSAFDSSVIDIEIG